MNKFRLIKNLIWVVFSHKHKMFKLMYGIKTIIIRGKNTVAFIKIVWFILSITIIIYYLLYLQSQ